MEFVEKNISMMSISPPPQTVPTTEQPPIEAPKKLKFSDTIDVEIGGNSISYRDVTSNPLYKLLEINSVFEMEIMLRISMTYILGMQPGLSTFNAERSRKWAKFLEVSDSLEEDIHDLIIEICPYYLPPEGRWQISDLQALVEIYE
jgi:hypothetical protein